MTQNGDSSTTRTVTGSRPIEVGGDRAEVDEPADGPRQLGRYELGDRIGAGGMGMVFRATDPDLGREVAIKLLRASAADGVAQARLLREAQAMAKLAHPNVVTVYDVGVHDDQVFVAMELAERGSLTRWLAATRRPWREVLAAFVAAGRGLAAAHRAGLVHRDFKPDNVLLDAHGVPRVADFGLARHGGEAPADAAQDRGPAGSLTGSGSIMGTPRYMSPEQHRGGAVDARSDQFSFCVALWEALYGAPPFADDSRADLATAVKTGERRALADERGVPAWLRAALERGLRPVPADRFPSMDALLAELTRDRGARTRRLAWSAGILASTGLVVVILVKGHADTRCQGAAPKLAAIWNPRFAGEVRRAFAATGSPLAADTAQRVTATLDAYGRAWVTGRTAACRATVLEREQSAHLLDLRMQCYDRRLRVMGGLVDQLRHAADRDVVTKAAEAARGLPPLGDCDDTRALLAAVPPPADPAARAQVAALQEELDDAQALELAGKYPAAILREQSILARARALAYGPLLARALVQLGRSRAYNGELIGAEPLLREAITVGSRAGADATVAEAWVRLIRLVGWDLGRTDEGVALVPAADAAVARAGDDPRWRGQLLHAMATIDLAQGRYAEARSVAERALKMLTDALGPDDSLVSHALNTLAAITARSGNLAAADDYFRRAAESMEARLGPDHEALASPLANRASVLRALGRRDEARPLIERALAITEREHGRDNPDYLTYRSNLADLEEDAGRYAEALALEQSVLQGRLKLLGPDHPDVAESYEQISALFSELKRDDEALDYAKRAVDAWERHYGPSHPQVASGLLGLAGRYIDAKRCNDAIAPLDRALKIAQEKLGPNHRMLGYILTDRGRCEVRLGHPRAALPYLERGVALRERIGDIPAALGDSQYELAQALWKTGDRARAHALAVKAEANLAAAGAPRSEEHGQVETWLARHP